MASAAGTPAPPPPPARYRRRSLAGPVVLIALGILFLLGNMGYIGWGNLAGLFAQYWPVLIILWGVIKLIEHYDAQRQGYRSRGFGFRGIMLLALVIGLGIAASSAWRYHGALGDEFRFDDGGFGLFGSSHEYSDEIQQPFPAGASLRVISDRGDVKVVTWDENNIKVSVDKKVFADSQDAADKINARTKPSITVSGDQVLVNANISGAGRNQHVETNLEIFLPRKAAVEISTGSGDVTIEDRQGEIRISTTHGDVEVRNIDGNVSINMRRGSIDARNIRGDVNCNGRVNDTNLSEVDGSVRMTGDFFGTTQLSKVGHSVHFESSRTDMELAKLDGDLTLEPGDLKANQLAGPTRVVTRHEDVHLQDFSGPIRVENNNADVELHPGAQLSNIEITNHRGHIQVTLPANASFQLNAHTSRGEISCDFPQLKVENSDNESRVSGTVGSGGPQIQLSNDHGEIEIKKG